MKILMTLALVAMSFTMVHLGQQTKLTVLCHHALVAAKLLFGAPDLRYYALAMACATSWQTASTAPGAAQTHPKTSHQTNFCPSPSRGNEHCGKS